MAEIKDIKGNKVELSNNGLVINKNVVDILEYLIKEAKEGKLVGMAYARFNDNGLSGNGWSSPLSSMNKWEYYIKLGYAISVLNHKFYNDELEDYSTISKEPEEPEDDGVS